MVAVGVAKKADTGLLLRYGMLVGCLAPVALAFGGYYYAYGWWTTTAAVAVMSATGFFVLPAMQVLILEDFKHMSGLTAGISKLVMTLVSTGGSMVVSHLYDDGYDRVPCMSTALARMCCAHCACCLWLAVTLVLRLAPGPLLRLGTLVTTAHFQTIRWALHHPSF